MATADSRRKFIGASILGIGALATGMHQIESENRKMGKIALQLWTVRDLLERDYAGTIQEIADMGYYAVETIDPPKGMSHRDCAEIILGSGLMVCGAHVELPKDGKYNWLEVASAYDCKTMIWHGWPEDERYKTKVGTMGLVEVYHDALKLAQSNGMSFGLHNHWWEYEKQSGGLYPYQILNEQLDENIFFELDTYWAKVAGHNPADILKELGSRVKMAHIKDGPARFTNSLDDDEPEPMVAVGQGTQNFPEVVKAADGNIEWMIVELDNCASDMMTAVQESYNYLITQGLAQGKV